MKKCSKCNIKKTVDNFYKNYRNVDGLNGQCKACKVAYQHQRVINNPDYDKQHYIKNKHRLDTKTKKFFKDNPNYRKDYYISNKDKLDAQNTTWREDNPEKGAIYRAKYRATKLAQTPNMSQEELDRIDAIYSECADLSKSTNIPHEVDHIVPISKGGLHHPDNLQVITQSENRSKGNKLPQTD